ncbi:hypothetical protein ACFLW3_00235 [Chloroflexota bacterium]
MGIYPNVLMEDTIRPWTSDTLEEAFDRAKRHLRLEVSTAYDGLIRDTLTRCLVRGDDGYVWPDGMSSALLWWSPCSASE